MPSRLPPFLETLNVLRLAETSVESSNERLEMGDEFKKKYIVIFFTRAMFGKIREINGTNLVGNGNDFSLRRSCRYGTKF